MHIYVITGLSLWLFTNFIIVKVHIILKNKCIQPNAKPPTTCRGCFMSERFFGCVGWGGLRWEWGGGEGLQQTLDISQSGFFLKCGHEFPSVPQVNLNGSSMVSGCIELSGRYDCNIHYLIHKHILMIHIFFISRNNATGPYWPYWSVMSVTLMMAPVLNRPHDAKCYQDGPMSYNLWHGARWFWNLKQNPILPLLYVQRIVDSFINMV